MQAETEPSWLQYPNAQLLTVVVAAAVCAAAHGHHPARLRHLVVHLAQRGRLSGHSGKRAAGVGVGLACKRPHKQETETCSAERAVGKKTNKRRAHASAPSCWSGCRPQSCSPTGAARGGKSAVRQGGWIGIIQADGLQHHAAGWPRSEKGWPDSCRQGGAPACMVTPSTHDAEAVEIVPRSAGVHLQTAQDKGEVTKRREVAEQQRCPRRGH